MHERTTATRASNPPPTSKRPSSGWTHPSLNSRCANAERGRPLRPASLFSLLLQLAKMCVVRCRGSLPYALSHLTPPLRQRTPPAGLVSCIVDSGTRPCGVTGSAKSVDEACWDGRSWTMEARAEIEAGASCELSSAQGVRNMVVCDRS